MLCRIKRDWSQGCTQFNPISFLSFAVDIIIFAKANVDTSSEIKNLINNYCKIFGQTVNLNKSVFQTTINIDQHEKDKIQNKLQISLTITL